MGLSYSSNSATSDMAKQLVDEKIRENKVMVFSKTYCGFCAMAKKALKEIDAEFTVLELDKRDDGDAIQRYLKTLTGQSSVPRVFIHGNCIGGGTETQALKNSGELKKMICKG